MTTSRSQTSGAEAGADRAGDAPTDETPELNVYEIHAERTVLTGSESTDCWIATDTLVTPPQ